MKAIHFLVDPYYQVLAYLMIQLGESLHQELSTCVLPNQWYFSFTDKLQCFQVTHQSVCLPPVNKYPYSKKLTWEIYAHKTIVLQLLLIQS